MSGKEKFTKKVLEIHHVVSHLNPTRRGQRTDISMVYPLEIELSQYMRVRTSSGILFITSFKNTLILSQAQSEMENVNRYKLEEVRSAVQSKINEALTLNEEQRQIGLIAAMEISEGEPDVSRSDIEALFETSRNAGIELAKAFYSGRRPPALKKINDHAERIRKAEAKIPSRILDSIDEAFTQE